MNYALVLNLFKTYLFVVTNCLITNPAKHNSALICIQCKVKQIKCFETHLKEDELVGFN